MRNQSSQAPPELDVVDYIEHTRTTYERLGFEPYRWVENATSVELAKLSKPLSKCRLALIASGGIYRAGQVAFTFKDDTSYRRIPVNVAASELRITHFAYDLTDARCDPNVVFPLRALKKLVAGGFLGSLASYALTFMGGIYSSRRVREELSPRLLEEVAGLDADIALLVPV